MFCAKNKNQRPRKRSLTCAVIKISKRILQIESRIRCFQDVLKVKISALSDFCRGTYLFVVLGIYALCYYCVQNPNVSDVDFENPAMIRDRARQVTTAMLYGRRGGRRAKDVRAAGGGVPSRCETRARTVAAMPAASE